MPQHEHEEAASTEYGNTFWESAIAGIPDDNPQPTQAEAMVYVRKSWAILEGTNPTVEVKRWISTWTR